METTPQNSFRRKFPRRPFTRAVGILYRGDFSTCRGLELGEGGIAFESTTTLPLYSECVVSFQLPDGSFISLRAVIKNNEKMNDRNAGKFHVGCAFIDLKIEFKREIRSYVAGRK